MKPTLSERVIEALKQLEQFQPCQAEGDTATCVLSGVQVRAVADPDAVDHGAVSLTFPGGRDVEADGGLYLRLKAIESVRLEIDGGAGESNVARRVQDLLEHLRRKHALS